MEFKRGDTVAWEKGKKTMVGQIYLVVPPKRDGFITLREKDALCVLWGGDIRNHESYIIGPFGNEPTYKHTYYQPRVKLLRKVEREEDEPKEAQGE